MSRTSPPRFTILRHEIGDAFHREGVNHQGGGSVASGSVHWDWLFETDAEPNIDLDNDSGDDAAVESNMLRTFATDELLLTDLGTEIRFNAIELPPHRKVYLDFEGDIGQDRGVVRQVVTGTFEATMITDGRLEGVLIPKGGLQRIDFPKAELLLERNERQWTMCLSRV